MKNKVIYAVTPARMNSKGIKNKNLKSIKNKSLLKLCYDTAKKTKLIDEIVISSDSDKIIKKAKANLVGFAAIIDRSSKKTLKIKKKIVSHLKIDVPTYKKNKLPDELKFIPITAPGSRFIK